MFMIEEKDKFTLICVVLLLQLLGILETLPKLIKINAYDLRKRQIDNNLLKLLRILEKLLKTPKSINMT